MCTEKIHQMLIQEEDAINCIFCCKQIQDPSKPKRSFCCSNMNIIKDISCVRDVAKCMII